MMMMMMNSVNKVVKIKYSNMLSNHKTTGKCTSLDCHKQYTGIHAAH